MLALFSYLSYSQYLPFSSTSSTFYDVYTDRKFESTKKNSKRFIIAFLNDTDESFRPCINMFSKLPTIYSEDITFGVVLPTTAPRAFEKLDVTENSVFFYTDGLLSFSVPFPLTEFELSSTIDYFVKPVEKPIGSSEELFRELPDVDFTILSPPEMYKQSKGYISMYSEGFGSIAVLPVEAQVLVKLNFTGKKLCLYRKADKIITEFDDSFDGFRMAAQATFYPSFSSDMFELIDGYVGLLIVEQAATQEQKNLLSNLGREYKDVFFGVITTDEAEPLYDLTGYSITESNTFVLFNYSEYVYYPPQKFTTSIRNFISHVLIGKIKPLYPSEEIPENQTDPYITKVVGKTYEDFINQPNPVFMFYLSDGHEGIRAAHKLGKYYSKNNMSTKVGYILYKENACQLKFPPITFDPTAVYFPANNKSAFTKHYFSNTLYGLLETEAVATEGSINISLFEYERELQFLVNLVPEVDSLDEMDQEMFNSFILSRGIQMGLGHSLPEVVDNILSRSGGIVSGFKDITDPIWFGNDEYVENGYDDVINGDDYVIYEYERKQHHSRHHGRHHLRVQHYAHGINDEFDY